MIRNLVLFNYKCFKEDIRIPFSRINVLYGKNGRGKSSAIQSLLLLSQSVRRNGGNLNTLAINGDMVGLGTFDDIRNRYNLDEQCIRITVESEEEEPLKLTYGPDTKYPTLARLEDIWVGNRHYVTESESAGSTPFSVPVVLSENNIKTFLPQSDIKTYELLRNILYVSANRRGPVNFEARNDKSSAMEVDSHGENLINLLSTQSNSFLLQFGEELSYILYGASVRIYPNPDTPDRIELFLDSRDGNNHAGFRPKNVGFGYSYILPVIYQAMSAPDGGTVIVENPEAHLYPGAQSRLVDFLIKFSNRKNLQVILETHSDHIINGLRLAIKNNTIGRSDASVLFFDREKDDFGTPEIEQILIDSHGSLSNEPEDFMDEWTRQMLALL